MMCRMAYVAVSILFLTLTGCVTVSSIYTGANPNHTIENADGTTTFEFLFDASDYDGNLAAQRVREYLAGYSKANGFGSFDVVSVNAAYVEKSDTGANALHAVGAGLSAYGGNFTPPEHFTTLYVRVLVEIKFKK